MAMTAVRLARLNIAAEVVSYVVSGRVEAGFGSGYSDSCGDGDEADKQG